MKAWVVFSGVTDLWWLKFFRPGFRHCYVILQDRWQWVSVDPLSHYTEIAFHHHVRKGFDLPAWLRGRGLIVVETEIREPPRRCSPCMIFTCVEAVKRLLGIHRRFIITPWQLYRYLLKGQKHGIHQTPRHRAASCLLPADAGRAGPRADGHKSAADIGRSTKAAREKFIAASAFDAWNGA